MKFKLSIVIIFIIFTSTNLLALTLSKMQVTSKQDEPLNAVIDVVFSKGDSASNLKPAIASKENYDANGLSRLPIHSDIQMRLEADGNGAKIFLSSKKIVKDPFLDLLIQIDSEKGRVYKEYTVLLDPPAPKEVKEVKAPKEVKEVKAPKEVKEVKAPKEVKEVKAPKEVKEVKAPKEVKTKIVKSSNRKTLYQIARENKPSGVTTEQMVLAIYQNNLKAFSEDNVNTLIKNKKLKIPPVSYFENHTHMEARKILRDHNNAWKNRVKEITKKTKSKIKQPVTSSNKDNEKIKQLEKELVQAKQKIEQISKNVEEKKLPNIEKIDAPIANKITSKDVFQNKEDLNKVETIKNKIVEKDDGVFVSAISDIDDGQIIESEINSQDKKGLETIHILLLTLFFVLLFGLIVVISRRKANERNQQLRSFSEEVEAQNENNNDQSLNSSKQFETKNPVSNQKDSEDSAHQDQSNPTAKKNYLPIADDEETKKL